MTGGSDNERRKVPVFSEEFLEALTDRVSEKLEGRLYVALGKAAFRALLLLVGTLGAGALAWTGLAGKTLENLVK